jgi:hypothetical protein
VIYVLRSIFEWKSTNGPNDSLLMHGLLDIKST